jgi:alkylated DNA repair dioxygenase AlkB
MQPAMPGRSDLPFQRGLFGAPAPSFDPSFAGVRRIALDATSWVDHEESWVTGADALFEAVLRSRDWSQRERWMYQRRVREPRLTAPWTLRSGLPLEPPVLEAMREALGARYGVTFDAVGFNLYRDGRDSVAWHRDHILKEIAEPVIALVSLGERRRFHLRPHHGGPAHTFLLGGGDLLVTGGRSNLDWVHTVPKVARAGPRISLAFRYGMDLRAYAAKDKVEPDR